MDVRVLFEVCTNSVAFIADSLLGYAPFCNEIY